MEDRALENECMGTESPVKLILRFALPSVFTMVIASMYNVVDKIFIGNGVGYLGLAATTASVSVMMLMNAVGALIGTGASIYLATQLGKGNRQEAKRTIAAAFLCEVLAGLLITAVGRCFLDEICAITGAGAETIGYVKTYLGIIILGGAASCVGSGLIPVIRAQGRPTAALILACTGSVANCVLDPLFIFGFEMGIGGAAVATVLSQLLSAVLVTVFLLRNKSDLCLEFKTLRHKGKDLYRQILSLGAPGFLMSALSVVMIMILTNTVQYYGEQSTVGGDAALSAIGLSTSIGDLITMVGVGMQQGILPLVAYNYGAKKQHRVRKIFWLGFVSLVVILVAFWVVLELDPQTLIALFGEAADLAFAVRTVRIFNFMLPMLAVQMFGGMYLQATGRVKRAMVVAMVRNVLFAIPLLLILPRFLGLDGVIFMSPAADVGGALVSAALTLSVMRRERRADEETQAAESID